MHNSNNSNNKIMLLYIIVTQDDAGASTCKGWPVVIPLSYFAYHIPDRDVMDGSCAVYFKFKTPVLS